MARTLELISGAHAETEQAFLLYWRGVLFQCLGQYERAKDDLEAFVEAEKGSNVYVDQVQQAKLRLERAGRQVASAGAGLAAERVRWGRGVEGGLKLGAGASIRNLACTDATTRLSSSHCVGGASERKRSTVQPHVLHAAASFDALPAAVAGFGAAGRFDLALADATLDQVPLLLPSASTGIALGPVLDVGLDARWVDIGNAEVVDWYVDVGQAHAVENARVHSTRRLDASVVLGLQVEFGGPPPGGGR